MKKTLIIILVILNMFLLLSCSGEVVIEEEITDDPEIIEEEEEEEEVIIIEEDKSLEDDEIIEEEIIVNEETIINSLGKEGFDQWETGIKVGETVIFINSNPEQKDMVITFQKERSREFFNSDITPYNEKYEHTFDEEGDYYFWVLGYGKEAVITVESLTI